MAPRPSAFRILALIPAQRRDAAEEVVFRSPKNINGLDTSIGRLPIDPPMALNSGYYGARIEWWNLNFRIQNPSLRSSMVLTRAKRVSWE